MPPEETKEELPPVMFLPKAVDPEVVHERALKLRAAFKAQFAESIGNDVYDSRDLERLENNDKFVGCFLLNFKAKGDVDKAVHVVDEVFRFRKEQGIWDWKDEDFPKEIWDKRGLYYHGKDKNGNPILHVRVKTMTASTAEEIAMAKKFVAWHFEKHHREKAGEERVVLLYDMEGAGLANVSLEMSKYTTKLMDLFPSFGIYVMNFELPWLLSAFWKAVSLFLSEEQRSRVVVVGKKEIRQYIAEEHLLEHQK